MLCHTFSLPGQSGIASKTPFSLQTGALFEAEGIICAILGKFLKVSNPEISGDSGVVSLDNLALNRIFSSLEMQHPIKFEKCSYIFF